MEFYPNNISVNQLGFAVSSSLAKTGSLIANFSALSVNTASFALNITGSAGTNGTGAVLPGPKGPRGSTGVTGPRGDSVYLISSSWFNEGLTSPITCGTPPTNCWTVNLYAAYEVFGNYNCDFSSNPPYNPVTYYTTTGASQLDVNTNFGANFSLYTNNVCTDPVTSSLSGFTFPVTLGAHLENGQNSVYAVDSNSSSSLVTTCYSAS